MNRFGKWALGALLVLPLSLPLAPPAESVDIPIPLPTVSLPAVPGVVTPPPVILPTRIVVPPVVVPTSVPGPVRTITVPGGTTVVERPGPNGGTVRIITTTVTAKPAPAPTVTVTVPAPTVTSTIYRKELSPQQEQDVRDRIVEAQRKFGLLGIVAGIILGLIGLGITYWLGWRQRAEQEDKFIYDLWQDIRGLRS